MKPPTLEEMNERIKFYKKNRIKNIWKGDEPFWVISETPYIRMFTSWHWKIWPNDWYLGFLAISWMG